MNLLVDIGNSRIKWANQNLQRIGKLRAAVYSKDNVSACLNREWHKLKKPEQIWVANVAGKNVARQLSQWTRARWGIRPRFAQVSAASGRVRNAYADPGRLGVDRWLALLAAWNTYGTAACIVDCGTAVTIDGLDGTGKHLGGLILPGVPMMRQALYQNAPGIPAPGTGRIARVLANNTGQAVITGCTLSIVALIDRIAHTLRLARTGKFTCIITGGAANEIRPLLATRFIHDPLLVLKGLVLMFGPQA